MTREERKRIERQREKKDKQKANLDEKRNIRKTIDNYKYEEAEKMIKESLEKNPNDIYALYEYGRLYNSKKEYEEARKIFNYLIETNSKNKYYALYELGKLEAKVNNLSKALDCFVEILNSSHKDKSHAKLELAKVKRRRNSFDEAEILLKELIREKADNSLYAELELTEIYIMSNRLYEAENILNKLKYDQTNIKIVNFVLLQRGKIEVGKNNYEKAKELFKGIVKTRASQSKNALTELAKLAFEEGNIEKFKSLSTKILGINDGNDTEIKILLNKVYQTDGLVEEARTLLKDNLNNNYNNDSVSLTYLNLGILEVYQHDIVLAKTYFNQSLNASDKFEAESLRELLFLDIKEENFNEAYKKIEKLVELANSSLEIENCKMLKLQLDITTKNKTAYENINLSYRMKQLENYSKEKAIEHIKEHTRINPKKLEHAIFNPDIDIEELYEWAKERLIEDNYIRSCPLDIYLLNYPNIGYCKDETRNCLKVITNPNTKNIITMYPFDKERMFVPETKTNKKITEKKLVKEIKIESQIDKFNKRYGIK